MPLGTIDGGFMAKGILSRATGFLGGFTFKFWLALCAALLACIPLAYCKGQADGKAIESAKTEKAARKAVERARKADEDTNVQRQADTERNTDADLERKEAARNGGRDAVNCARLRRAYPDSPIPACD